MKVVKLLDQASKDGPRGSLREQVGEHHDAGEVFDRDNATVDEIAKELGPLRRRRSRRRSGSWWAASRRFRGGSEKVPRMVSRHRRATSRRSSASRRHGSSSAGSPHAAPPRCASLPSCCGRGARRRARGVDAAQGHRAKTLSSTPLTRPHTQPASPSRARALTSPRASSPPTPPRRFLTAVMRKLRIALLPGS